MSRRVRVGSQTGEKSEQNEKSIRYGIHWRKFLMTDNKDRSSKTDDDNKQMRDAERMHTLNEEYLKLANEAAVKYAEAAVKAIMLINGGASVSLLAFIGGLTAQGKVQLRGISLFANSLMWFASGVLSAAIVAAL